ncbi:unnamed protein product [Lactuca saligna]|uniref:Protein kinase domain-containing protein n=1 Tax=Lactuca saligna TaxID=75948 RepID=A0AA35ZZA1_LACSI|nr:unnamed protein product [Lactuca saligna]
MTPEIVQGRGHDKAADWWSVGILTYEMLSGKPSFRGGNRQKIQEKIVKDKIKHLGFLSSEAHSLLKGNFPGALTFLPGKPIWPDLCVASYKLSWQPSTVVLDRHLLAKDIVYVLFCCYCGFGNILAYWSNCMYLT